MGQRPIRHALPGMAWGSKGAVSNAGSWDWSASRRSVGKAEDWLPRSERKDPHACKPRTKMRRPPEWRDDGDNPGTEQHNFRVKTLALSGDQSSLLRGEPSIGTRSFEGSHFYVSDNDQLGGSDFAATGASQFLIAKGDGH